MGSPLLSPGSWCAQGFVCALQESASLVLCKFWWFYGGVNGNLIQEGLCYTHGYCTQSPCPCSCPLLTCTLQETLKHISCSVSVGTPDAHKVLSEPFDCLWWVWGLSLNAISPLLLSCWGFSFAFGCGVSFLGEIQHSLVDGCSAASGNFGVLAGEDECTFFYPAIF